MGELKKQNRWTFGQGKKEKKGGRETNHKKLLMIENKLRIAKEEMGRRMG